MQIDSQKVIHLSPSKVQTHLLAKLNNLQKKSTDLQHNTTEIIDSLIQVIQNAEDQLTTQENSHQLTAKVLLKLHKDLTEIKPLKRIKDQFSDTYKKISGLMKLLDEQEPNNQNDKLRQVFNEEQIKQIQYGIGQHYFRQGKIQCGNAIYEEHPKKQILSQCLKLKNQINHWEFDEAISWVEGKKLQNLQYELKKLKLLKLIKNQQGQKALEVYQGQMAKFLPNKEQQVSMLMGYMMMSLNCYWGSQTQYQTIFKERYHRFQSINVQAISQEFQLSFYRFNDIPMSDTLSFLYKVGKEYQQQFLNNLEMIPNQKPKVLPFSIESKPQYHFHSIFYCPITKQIYDSKEGGAMLQCGHIVSIGAIRRIEESRDNRRTQKCPVCQKEITKNSDKKVHF